MSEKLNFFENLSLDMLENVSGGRKMKEEPYSLNELDKWIALAKTNGMAPDDMIAQFNEVDDSAYAKLGYSRNEVEAYVRSRWDSVNVNDFR